MEARKNANRSPSTGNSGSTPYLAAVLFAVAVLVVVFVAGAYVGRYKKPPYDTIRSALVTYQTWKSARERIRNPRNYEPSSLFGREGDARIEFVSGNVLADPVLLQAKGAGELTEHCPAGCLAVEYAGAGEAVHAYPYFPDSIGRAPLLVDWPYEHALGTDFVDYVEIETVSMYSNRDLLVELFFRDSHPAGGGVARINPDGRVLWYRRDYIHHQVHLTQDGLVLAPSMRLVRDRRDLPDLFPHPPEDCNEYIMDYVHVLNGDGAMLTEASVLSAVLASPWRPVLEHSTDRCDPTHLNFVHEVGEDAAGVLEDVEPGDLVLSLRNLSAIGVLDRESLRLKRLHRGTFHHQHSVTHLEGSKFILFDNRGARQPLQSRLLVVDLATGDEVTVFPGEATPARFRGLYSRVRGYISVSPDRQRVIATYSGQGALEVRIADGAVLTAFRTGSQVATYVNREQ